MLNNKQLIDILRLLAILAVFYVVLKFVLLPIVTSAGFREFTENSGLLGYVLVIGYIVVSQVFIPLAGTPGVVLGVTIYGINTGMWLLYIAGLISATINFYISRKFGRAWVERLTGKKALKEIDAFTAVEGKEFLIVSRLVGFAIFDFISYAAGLTNIKFRDYFLITALVSIIPNLIFRFFFRNIDMESEQGIMIWVGTIAIAAVIFGIFIKLYISKRNRHLKNNS